MLKRLAGLTGLWVLLAAAWTSAQEATDGGGTNIPPAPTAVGKPDGEGANQGIDADALLRDLPVLTETSEKLDSLTIGFSAQFTDKETNFSSTLRYRYCYQRPGRFSLCIMEGTTRFPIAVIAEGRIAWFDPIQRVVSVGTAKRPPGFWAFQEGDTFLASAGMAPEQARKEYEHTIFFDAAAIYAGNMVAGKVTHVTTGPRPCWLVDATTARGNHGFYRLDPARPYPLISIDLQSPDWRVVLDPIAVNEKIDLADLVLPDLDALAPLARVVQEDPDHPLATILRQLPSMMRSVSVMVSGSPEMRANLEKAMGRTVDWDQTRAYMRKVGPEVTAARQLRAKKLSESQPPAKRQE